MTERYPTDRIVYFSDAIFAIAITLLVLDIKVPSNEDLLTYGTWGVLRRSIPSFTGFLVSFLVTALYWKSHLVHAQYIKRFDTRLLWLNIWLLLFVVLMPFSTSFYVRAFNLQGPFVFYCANLVVIGIFNYLIIRRIVRLQGYDEALSETMANWLLFRSRNAPAIFLLSIAVSFFAPLTARFLFVLIFLLQIIGDRYYKRKEEVISS